MSPFPIRHRSSGSLIGVGVFASAMILSSIAVAQNDFSPSPYPLPATSSVPTSVWSVTSPNTPDPAIPGANIDHSSMSPDSWSAPSTPVAAPSLNGLGGSLFPSDLSSQPSSLAGDNQFEAAPSIPSLPGSLRSPQNDGPSDRSNKLQRDPNASPFRPSGFSKPSPQIQGELNAPQSIQPALSNPLLGNAPQLPSDVVAPSPGLERYPLGVNLQQAAPEQGNDFSSFQSAAPVVRTQEVPTDAAIPGVRKWQPSAAVQPYQPQSGVPIPAPTMFGVRPNYRPDLGHRSPSPTVRNFGTWDNGDKFDFEDKKKEYPPFSEILATGRYFGSASVLYVQPSFQTNTAITTLGPTFGESLPFDFDYETAPELRLGFESKYGPGLELVYWQYDESANPATFTSNGVVSGEASTWMMGPSRWSRLTASNAGERLDANHTIDVESLGAYFFKEVQLPISRINGAFGFQYVSIAQTLDATLTQGGSTIGRLNSRSDMRAYGPRFMFEYYRPVGHTKLEFITKFGGSVLFGERDQFVENTLARDFSRVGADEFVTTTEFYSGLQVKKMIAEKRGFYGRIGFQYQVWHGGGTAVDAQEDFGLRGFVFGVGYNR